ncbi:MAG: DNA starvation/stationary phase protection protein, partial [Epulopiscium sp.]|nr:DNA starvation/stationary phase protection protein [Candidatus Epulonipiscium sp.]
GMEFKPIHDFTETLYDEAFKNFDDVAERLKILGFPPYVKLSDYVKHSAIEEIDGKDFRAKEVVDIVYGDIEILKKLATQIRDIADKENDFVTVAQFEDYVESFDKHLWFLHAMGQ